MEKKIKFEDKMNKIEEIISSLETGEIDLDDSINKYTEAMKLIKECDGDLKKVEKQVNKLVSESGEEENFEITDEN